MSDKEILSALFDGELDRDQIRFALKRVRVEEQQLFDRYDLISASLRKQLMAAPKIGFADSVMLALEAEVEQPSRSNWRRYASGFGIAASVAVVALFLVKPQTIEDGESTTNAGQLAVESLLRTDDLNASSNVRHASNGGQVAAPLRHSYSGLQGEVARPAGYNIAFDMPLDPAAAVPWEQTVVHFPAPSLTNEGSAQ